MKQESVEYSVVVPVYNEEGNILDLYNKLKKVFNNESWELIFINDSSKDSSLEIIKSLSKKDDRIKYLSFSRNFGHQSALTAGMDHASGKAIITMDCDLQDPPELIYDMYKKIKDGYDLVYAKRSKRAIND